MIGHFVQFLWPQSGCGALFVLLSGVLLDFSYAGQGNDDAFQEKSLSEWLKDLDTDDERRTAYAFEAVCSFGSAALPGLLEALESSKKRLQFWAARSLEELGPEAKNGLPALKAALLRGGDVRTVQAVAETLANLGAEGCSALQEALESKDKTIRKVAAVALLRFHPKRAKAAMSVLIEMLEEFEAQRQQDTVNLEELEGKAFFIAELSSIGADALPALMKALRYEHPWFSEAACLGLQKLGPRAKPAGGILRERLQSGDERFRLEAAIALTRIDPTDGAAFKSLVSHLEHRDPNIRQRARKGLGSLGAAAAPAVEALTRAMKHTEYSDFQSRIEIVAVFEAIGPAARSALEALGSDSADVLLRRIVKGALGKAGIDDLPELLLMLESSDHGAREWAAKAIGKIGPPALPLLKEALETEKPDESWVISALREVGPQSVPILLGIMNHKNPAIRQQAIIALGAVGKGVEEASKALKAARSDFDANCRASARNAVREIFMARE